MLGLMVEVLIAVDGSTLGSLAGPAILDRKSTRLNSSHLVISYAVFCLKKKKVTLIKTAPPPGSATPAAPSPFLTAVEQSPPLTFTSPLRFTPCTSADSTRGYQ